MASTEALNVVVFNIRFSCFRCEHYIKHFHDSVQCLSYNRPKFCYVEWSHETIKKYTTCSHFYILHHFRCKTIEANPLPENFMDALLNFTKPVTFHFFSNMPIQDGHLQQSQKILQENQHLLDHDVRLHLFDKACDTELKFIHCFQGMRLTLYHNSNYMGMVNPLLGLELTFDNVLSDENLKLSLLAQLAYTPREVLKDKLRALRSIIMPRYSIEHYYAHKNVMGCVLDVVLYSWHPKHLLFQRKILHFLDLLASDLEDPVDWSRLLKPHEPFKLVCKDIGVNNRYPNYKSCCIPVQQGTAWFRVPSHPFAMLESESTMKGITEAIGPLRMRHFSRCDQGESVYLLNNQHIAPRDLIRHNNGVLSALLQNQLPGCSVLWQIVFLYVLAQRRFPVMKRRLYEEIRFLGDQEEFFVTLHPFSNPPIVTKLNICFWYVAHISHRVFANSRQNVLRSFPFNSQLFLQFYRDVYEQDYKAPEELPSWLAWKSLCLKREAIFPILAHYFEYERLEEEEGANPFLYILYNKKRSRSRGRCDVEPGGAAFRYLKQLELDEVLRMYRCILDSKSVSVYDSIYLQRKGVELPLNDQVETEALDHVQIHLRTCQPLVTCPVTHKHWKLCAGNYNKLKESGFQFFKEYCLKYEKYPNDWKELLVFMNERIYKRQGKVPNLFPESVKQKVERVIKLFRKVMETYTCKQYLKQVRKYRREEKRKRIEQRFSADDSPSAEELAEL